MNYVQLLLSTYRALLFNIICSVRFIYLEQLENTEDKVNLFIYSDRELTEDEKDIYFAVAAEISGDYCDMESPDVHFIVDNREYDPKNYQGKLVYARYG
jgi:hypothetical protein